MKFKDGIYCINRLKGIEIEKYHNDPRWLEAQEQAMALNLPIANDIVLEIMHDHGCFV